MKIGIYVHIPFCIKKCYYCDFVSYANSFEMQDDYIKKLKQEIEENKEYLKNNPKVRDEIEEKIREHFEISKKTPKKEEK